MTPAERKRHRAEQNRLAQQKARSRHTVKNSIGTDLLSDNELAILEAIEAQEPTIRAQRGPQLSELDEDLLEELRIAADAQAKAGRPK